MEVSGEEVMGRVKVAPPHRRLTYPLLRTQGNCLTRNVGNHVGIRFPSLWDQLTIFYG
jgi:hypothetical protein